MSSLCNISAKSVQNFILLCRARKSLNIQYKHQTTTNRKGVKTLILHWLYRQYKVSNIELPRRAIHPLLS